jgi:hypothetical protein
LPTVEQTPVVKRFATASVLIVTAATIVGLLVLLVSGVSLGSSVRLTVVVLLQGFAGWLVWSRLRPRAEALERLGVGLALGTVMSLLAGLVVQAVGLGNWGWILPPLVAVVWAAVARVRRGSVSGAAAAAGADRSSIVALLISGALGLGILVFNLRNYPLVWEGPWSRYHTDMPFFEALATSLSRFGPTDSIFLPGAQVRYHWLSYAWAGQVTDAAGAEPFVVLTRVLPYVAILACSLIVIAWARRMSSVVWVPSLAAVMLLIGGFLGAANGGVLNFDSPSQSMGVLWLLAFSIVLLEFLGESAKVPGRRRAWLLIWLGVLSFCLMGGKVSAVLPALAGVGLVALVGLLRRSEWWGRALLAFAVAVVAAGAAFVLILAGSAGGGGLTLGSLVDRSSSQQGLNPLDDPNSVVFGTAILLVAIAVRWAGLAWLAGARQSRWEPATVFGVGLAISSLLAVIAFNSFNEIWFSVAASGPLAVLTAVGAGEASRYLANGDSRRGNRLTLGALVGAAVIYGVVWALWATGASGGNVWVGTWRWAGPLVGVLLAVVFGWVIASRAPRGRRIASVLAATAVILVFATAPGRLLGVGTGQVGIQQPGLKNDWFSIGKAPSVRDRDQKVVTEWTSDQMSAAAWLRSHAGRDDLLATNLTFGPFVPGVTGLRTYVSAIQYQAPYGAPADAAELLAREGRVWDFIEGPTATTVQPLCRAGVRWIWVDLAQTAVRDWQPFADIVFNTADTTVLQVNPAACP